MDEAKFEWDVPSYEWRPRSVDWFWWVGTIVVIAAIIAVVFHNYLLAVVIVIAGIMVIALNKRQPSMHHIIVSDQAITVDDVVYDIKSLDGFWIAEPLDHSEYGKLMIHSSRGPVQLHTYLIDPDEVSLSELRTFLGERVVEREYRPNRLEVELDKYL